MTPEIGQFALALALAAALVQSVLPILGAARRNLLWMRSARSSAFAQVVLIGIAFAALMRSFVVSDFTVTNVVENSHSLKPMLFKIAGTWGSHEGSLLLWVLILAVFGAAVAFFGSNIPDALKARTLSVQAWISVGFLTFLLLTSNPFERVFPPPIDGTDLNPLLQDVGLAMHPPLLYFGYVGFSIVFSFAVKVYEKHTQANAINFVDHVVEKFPFRIREIRTDNGHEFQAKFHWHVEDLGIRHAYIKRGTPQLNGKVERSHRSDGQEFYQLLSYKGDVDLEARLGEWERFYNFHRPHGAHNGMTPYEALREKL